nr:hypothetical protein [Phenylobacterium sp. J367]
MSLEDLVTPVASTAPAAWTVIAEDPVLAQQGHAPVAGQLGGRLGLWSGQGVAVSDDGSLTWRGLAQPWMDIAYAAGAVHAGRAWLLGGYVRGAHGPGRSLVYSSPDLANWTPGPAAPWAMRSRHAAVAFGGRLVVMGGILEGANPREFAADVWASADGATWTQLTGAFPARAEAAVAVLSGQILVMGGRRGRPASLRRDARQPRRRDLDRRAGALDAARRRPRGHPRRHPLPDRRPRRRGRHAHRRLDDARRRRLDPARHALPQPDRVRGLHRRRPPADAGRRRARRGQPPGLRLQSLSRRLDPAGRVRRCGPARRPPPSCRWAAPPSPSTPARRRPSPGPTTSSPGRGSARRSPIAPAPRPACTRARWWSPAAGARPGSTTRRC